MAVKAQRHYRSELVLDILGDNRTKLFTWSIGGGQLGEKDGKKLEFEAFCIAAMGELKFYLDQVFSTNSMRSETKKPHGIDSYHWYLKVHAVVKRGTEVYLDSSEETQGLVTEDWRTKQTRRNIRTVGLGNACRFPASYRMIRGDDKTISLEADLTVKANIVDHEKTGNSRAMGLGLFALQRKDHSDLTIKCESEEIKAHKVVLKCYSPVFARMLDSPMDESATSVIHIDDFEPETIRYMIDFMYEGTLKNSSKDSIVALLDCAEKYDISELKVPIIQKILSIVTPDNAAEFAAALTKFRADDESKEQMFDYCKANLSKLSTNSYFRQFFIDNVKHFL